MMVVTKKKKQKKETKKSLVATKIKLATIPPRTRTTIKMKRGITTASVARVTLF